jgi:hypothetical protein
VLYSPAVGGANDFAISASPATLVVQPGTNSTSAISTSVISGTAATINLTASVSPSGPTVSITPASLTAGASSTLTVSISGSVPTGAYTVAINGAEGSAQHSTNVTVIVADTLWSNSTVPAQVAGSDSSVELGVKFTADRNGMITGIRFYKAAGNTGTHVGNLWNSNGQLLASAVFTGESSTGWQQVTFSSPVAITANTTYVASYHTNVGYYGFNGAYFSSSGWDNAPLHAPSSAASGGNGVFTYGSGNVFPNHTYNAANYWVDVLFE